MTVITIECPDSVLLSLHETGDHFAKELKLAAATKLYELGRLSSGRAAELAGMSRVAFFQCLSDFKVPLYSESPETLESDLTTALNARASD